jgi:hypothetical protein
VWTRPLARLRVHDQEGIRSWCSLQTRRQSANSWHSSVCAAYVEAVLSPWLSNADSDCRSDSQNSVLISLPAGHSAGVMPESDCIMDFGLRVVAAESRVCDRYTDRDCGKKAVTEPTKWALRPCGPTPCHLVCLCARLLSVAVPARPPAVLYTGIVGERGHGQRSRRPGTPVVTGQVELPIFCMRPCPFRLLPAIAVRVAITHSRFSCYNPKPKVHDAIRFRHDAC